MPEFTKTVILFTIIYHRTPNVKWSGQIFSANARREAIVRITLYAPVDFLPKIGYNCIVIADAGSPVSDTPYGKE